MEDNQPTSTRVGPSVEFTNLRYAFPVKRRRSGKKSEIVTLEALKSLTGQFGSGRLTAIMGPSGSGKTTLLNILAGRAGKGSIKNSELTGEISLDGKVINPVVERSRFAYVMSEDSLFATLTPRESLMYAARLRLPRVSQAERVEKVEKLIKSLNISNCANTLIGDENVKGISSGERKRTAVGSELIHDPNLLLLDEPTSGLDSYTAYELVANLREIASEGKSIVMTIHQPRSEIFDMFDDIVFLSKGSIVYQGPAKQVREYFDSLGYKCPEKHNPGDFVMNLIQTLPQEEIETKLVNSRDSTATTANIMEKRRSLLASPALMAEAVSASEKIHHATLSQQFRILLSREIKNTMRNKQVLGMRFVAAVLMSTLFGGVFWMVGKADTLESADALQAQILSYSGAVTFVCIQAMFANVQPILISFPKEKPIFIREYSGGSYSANIYFLCKTVVEVPVLAVQSALTILICYFMMGFSGTWLLFFLGHYLIALASTSAAIMLTSRVSQVKTAMELSPLVFVPQIFFSGVFVRIEQIPVALRWIQYIVPLKYGVNIVYIAELDQPKYPWAPELLDMNDVVPSNLWWYILVPIGLILAFRLIGLVSLVMKAKTTVF